MNGSTLILAVTMWREMLALDASAVVGITTSALAVISAVAVAWLSYRGNVKRDRIQASTQADVAAQTSALERQKAEIEQQRLNAEIAKQQRDIYSQLITDLRGELDRVRTQLDRMQAHQDKLTDQLGKEQDVSNLLRNDARTSQRQLSEMRELIDRLHDRIATLEAMLRQAGVTPPLERWPGGAVAMKAAPHID